MKRNKHTNRMRKAFRFLLTVALIAVCLVGCKTSRRAISSLSHETGCLSSKVQLTVPNKNSVLTVNGTLKLKSGERAQLSLLMPILRTEVACLEVTPDSLLLVDRMGKRYVRASYRELKNVLPRKANFSQLEKLIYAASQPGGKSSLTGQELGILSLEKGKIELFDFSDERFSMSPTRLSSKYKEVELSELLEMLNL